MSYGSAVLLVALIATVNAQFWSVVDYGVETYEDFDTYTSGIGMDGVGGTLDSTRFQIVGMTDTNGYSGFNSHCQTATCTRPWAGSTASSPGGLYAAFHPDGASYPGDRFPMLKPSEVMPEPGVVIRFFNQASYPINSVNIKFDIKYRDSTSRKTRVTCSYGVSANSISPGTWTSLPYWIPTEDGPSDSLSTYPQEVNITVPNSWPANQYLFFRILLRDHVSPTGSFDRDEVGIDNVALTAYSTHQQANRRCDGRFEHFEGSHRLDYNLYTHEVSYLDPTPSEDLNCVIHDAGNKKIYTGKRITYNGVASCCRLTGQFNEDHGTCEYCLLSTIEYHVESNYHVCHAYCYVS